MLISKLLPHLPLFLQEMLDPSDLATDAKQ